MARIGLKISLHVQHAFEDTKITAERKIQDLLCKKLDEFMEMNNYDFETTDSDVQPSSFLIGIQICF
jgi:hypothetical protein